MKTFLNTLICCSLITLFFGCGEQQSSEARPEAAETGAAPYTEDWASLGAYNEDRFCYRYK